MRGGKNSLAYTWHCYILQKVDKILNKDIKFCNIIFCSQPLIPHTAAKYKQKIKTAWRWSLAPVNLEKYFVSISQYIKYINKRFVNDPNLGSYLNKLRIQSWVVNFGWAKLCKRSGFSECDHKLVGVHLIHEDVLMVLF